MRLMKNDYISEIHEKDKNVLHPYEDLQSRGTYKRKLIVKSDNIYLYDEEGNRYIDGPGGMWCNNIGHGNKEIAEAIKKQIEKMDYCSPFSESTEVAAELATFLNAYNDSGKKQWVSKIKGEAISNPWTSGSYPSNLES